MIDRELFNTQYWLVLEYEIYLYCVIYVLQDVYAITVTNFRPVHYREFTLNTIEI